MPELPEVETVKSGLEKRFLNKTIAKVTHSDKKLRHPLPENIVNILTNTTIKSFYRRAKVLFIHLDNGYSLIFHLGMTGKIVFDINTVADHLHKHNHFNIYFDDETYLIFNDIRRFGYVDLCKTDEIEQLDYIKNLAPEPLTDDFNVNYLFDKLKNKQIAIKVAIMDNPTVVGVGNIYACESLFKAGIHPKTPSNKVSKKKLEVLVNEIKETLKIAIAKGGSTLKDYVQADGSLGYFQHEFFVYGKHNEDCKVCGTKIDKITLGQRSTFFCPKCQK
jgi:formamidopyrimidine-DNA glycosylase